MSIRKRFSRRELVTKVSWALGCVAFAPLLRSQRAALPPQRPLLTDAYLAAVDASEGEPLAFGASLPKGFVPWNNVDPRPVAAWPADDRSIDYRHIGESRATDEVSLSAEALRDLLLANAFPLEAQTERILFGLRGCRLAQPNPDSVVLAPAIRIAEDVPDHMSARCVLGVLSVKPLGIWATTASTVPGVDRVYEAAKAGRPANLLPTGAHNYRVGPHGTSFHDRARLQPAAFLQRSPVSVLRAFGDISYVIPDQRWDFDVKNPSDNIHAAVRDAGRTAPYFSSAGCQTIPGDYDLKRTTPLGLYAQFREAAGLRTELTFTNSARSETVDDGRRFLYALLTGREARLATDAAKLQSLRRLRFGSQSDSVRQLRSALALPKADVFDRDTMIALIKWQLEKIGVADAIVTPTIAKQLGIAL